MSQTQWTAFCDVQLELERLPKFGICILGVQGYDSEDYLNEILLAPNRRMQFVDVVRDEGFVVLKRLRRVIETPEFHAFEQADAMYRPVHGKTGLQRLSPAEYYHHDGSHGPGKPLIAEIRMPFQNENRHIATSVAPFREVIRAMLVACQDGMQASVELAEECAAAVDGQLPPVARWERIQGILTRSARKELSPFECRGYFGNVDRLAQAYTAPWEMGESRWMLNFSNTLENTFQHRRAVAPETASNQANGKLIKRWPAEAFYRTV